MQILISVRAALTSRKEIGGQVPSKEQMEVESWLLAFTEPFFSRENDYFCLIQKRDVLYD